MGDSGGQILGFLNFILSKFPGIPSSTEQEQLAVYLDYLNLISCPTFKLTDFIKFKDFKHSKNVTNKKLLTPWQRISYQLSCKTDYSYSSRLTEIDKYFWIIND